MNPVKITHGLRMKADYGVYNDKRERRKIIGAFYSLERKIDLTISKNANLNEGKGNTK